MNNIETIVCLDKSRIQFSEYQKFKEQEQNLAKRIYELQSDLSREKSKNEKLIEDLKNEKQLNAEIKKRLVEVEYDCEEFNHEYCDINCKGKRKELVDLYQLISDGLNETLLKQKDEEIKRLEKELLTYKDAICNRECAAVWGESERLKKENEQLKEYNTDLKQSLDWANKRETEWSNRIEELKTDLEYAKAIIKDLLNNSHEYSRQNAEDFIKGEKK